MPVEALCLQKPKEGIKPTGAGVSSCEQPNMGTGTELSTVEEQQEPLTTEPSLLCRAPCLPYL